MNRDLIGKVYASAEAYQVGREKVREFASAIGETSPICHDVAAARAAGYADVVAPLTFAFALAMRATDEMMFDPELGLEYAMAVHGSQHFSYRRPIVAGDEITVACRIADIAVRGSNEVLTTRSELTDAAGRLVVTTSEAIVTRGTAGGSA
jgi:acyl dehydratase